METEYAVLYFPDDPEDSWGPPFSTIEELLLEALLEGRKAAVSSGLKGGYFLENGGLVHLEVFLRTQGDTPILEASTPECRSPRDLLIYQRAFDLILTQISLRSRTALHRRGFSGRIGFGKNNHDSRGVGYGCHENYLIHEETRGRDRALALLAAPLVCVLLFPSAFFLFSVLMGVVLGSTAARWLPDLASAVRRGWNRAFPKAKEKLRAAYFIIMNALLYVPISVYSFVVRSSAFRGFQRDLTSFLVTRQLLAGAGGLDLKDGFFEVSQRPRLTTSLGEIVMFGRHKTIFDLKGLLYDPLSLFRKQKKLTVTLGDSNLSDISSFLKIGTTALVIEMIEEGVEFAELRLRRPIQAFRETARGGPWKELWVKGAGDPATPGRRTAIDIQREYLRLARAHFAGRPEGRLRHQEILDLWQEVLTLLADQPGRLAEKLDWAAKKSLLDRAILPAFTWREFLAWGRIFSRASPERLAAVGSLEELLYRSGPLEKRRLQRQVRAALKRKDLDPARFREARELFHLARKIDLRYHEIGAEAGYQRQLESEGLLQRLTSEVEVARATRDPPADTRARIRGYYIGLGQSPESIRANWTEVEIAGASRSIPLPDPFQFRLPTD